MFLVLSSLSDCIIILNIVNITIPTKNAKNNIPINSPIILNDTTIIIQLRMLLQIK